MRHALREARQCGYRAILLVGDTLYYGRFEPHIARGAK